MRPKIVDCGYNGYLFFHNNILIKNKSDIQFSNQFSQFIHKHQTQSTVRRFNMEIIFKCIRFKRVDIKNLYLNGIFEAFKRSLFLFTATIY